MTAHPPPAVRGIRKVRKHLRQTDMQRLAYSALDVVNDRRKLVWQYPGSVLRPLGAPPGGDRMISFRVGPNWERAALILQTAPSPDNSNRAPHSYALLLYKETHRMEIVNVPRAHRGLFRGTVIDGFLQTTPQSVVFHALDVFKYQGDATKNLPFENRRALIPTFADPAGDSELAIRALAPAGDDEEGRESMATVVFDLDCSKPTGYFVPARDAAGAAAALENGDDDDQEYAMLV